MDKPIQVGDLVVVVRQRQRPCMCALPSSSQIGRVFRVSEMSITASHCPECQMVLRPKYVAWTEDKSWVFELDRLKRIPPLDELEGERTEEKLKEPA